MHSYTKLCPQKLPFQLPHQQLALAVSSIALDPSNAVTSPHCYFTWYSRCSSPLALTHDQDTKLTLAAPPIVQGLARNLAVPYLKVLSLGSLVIFGFLPVPRFSWQASPRSSSKPAAS